MALYLLFLLVGFILGYFLNLYLAAVLAGIACVLIFILIGDLYFHPGPSGTSGGLGVLILITFLLTFLVGLFIGFAPALPWNKLYHWLNPQKIWEFVKTHIFR